VANFSKSWQDGLAFCALVNHYRPDLIDYNTLDPTKQKENMNLAFASLLKMGIDPLLDTEDILELPEEKSIRTYLMTVQAGVRTVRQDPGSLANLYKPAPPKPAAVDVKKQDRPELLKHDLPKSSPLESPKPVPAESRRLESVESPKPGSAELPKLTENPKKNTFK